MKTGKTPLILRLGALIIILIAVAYLVNNIILFRNTINQYVSQGYPAADVMKQLIPSQLLPGIFQPIAVYGGIALALFGISTLFKRLALLTKGEDYSNVPEVRIPEEEIVDLEEGDDSKPV